MLTIEMSQMFFHAHHGLYATEKSLGATFEVNMKIDYLPQTFPMKDLGAAINYVNVFELLQKTMQEPEGLLENLVVKIAQSVLEKYSLAQKVFVSVKKIHPPIPDFSGSIGVTYTAVRNE